MGRRQLTKDGDTTSQFGQGPLISVRVNPAISAMVSEYCKHQEAIQMQAMSQAEAMRQLAVMGFQSWQKAQGKT